MTFIRSHGLGKISRPPVTLVLTEKTLTDKDINSYESQLQVSTADLRRAIADQSGSPLVVICQAGAVQKRISIFFKGYIYRVFHLEFSIGGRSSHKNGCCLIKQGVLP